VGRKSKAIGWPVYFVLKANINAAVLASAPKKHCIFCIRLYLVISNDISFTCVWVRVRLVTDAG